MNKTGRAIVLRMLVSLFSCMSAAAAGCSGQTADREGDLSTWIESLEGALPPEHATVLSDGHVSFEEYEAAVFDTVRCLEGAGFTVVGPDLRFKGKRYVYSALGDADKDPSECFGKNQTIEDAWSLQNLPSEAELNEARSALAQCFRDHGVEVEANPAEGYFQRFAGSAVHRQCSNEVSEEYGLPFFGG